MNQFKYNGLWSYDDVGILLSSAVNYNAGERDITFLSVDGKSGDVAIDNGRYKNFKKGYKVNFKIRNPDNRRKTVDKIINWLTSAKDYAELTDTYDSEYFVKAIYSGDISIINQFNLTASAELVFNCQPYSYSFKGQNPIEFTKAFSLFNSENEESEPYFKIYGTGNCTLTVNGISYLIKNVSDYVEIDCDTMQCFKGDTKLNSCVSFYVFPTFKKGENLVSFSSNVTKIEVVPRWRKK